MKRSSSSLLTNNGIRLLCIGLVLLLVNTWLDLGVLSDSTTANPLAEWAFLAISLLSRVVSAIGIALIIGFITNYIKAKYIDDYRALSDSQVVECAKTIVSRFSKDKDYLNEYKEAYKIACLVSN